MRPRARADREGPHRTHRLGLCADHRAAGAGARDGSNLRIGNEIYRALLGARPRSRWSTSRPIPAGLVGLYLDAGYRAILMDWDNPARASSRMAGRDALSAATRAWAADGREIALLWTNTVAFQKLQRFAHGDIALDDYLDYRARSRSGTARARCASMPAMRRFSISVPAASAPKKRWRRKRMGAAGARPSRRIADDGVAAGRAERGARRSTSQHARPELAARSPPPARCR